MKTVYECRECHWKGKTPSVTDASEVVHSKGKLQVDRIHKLVCPSCFGTDVHANKPPTEGEPT
jgi:hypothetical protein